MAILEWQNLIFLLPMVAALLYVLMMSLGSFGGGHGDLDVGHDVHVDVGHDVSGDGHPGEGGHGPQVNLVGRIFGFLGMGKVPLSILGLSLCVIWGATGLVLNALLGMENLPRVLLFAALAALLGARALAEGIALLLPREESHHTPKEDLVGQVGEVLYEITTTSGTVRLRDPSGNLLDLDCRIQAGDGIKAGTTVVLQEYESTRDVFFVRG